MKHAKLVEEAKRDPSRIYANPWDVLHDRRLGDAQRLEILKSWEEDARALSQASDEAMGGGEPSRLQDVTQAREQAEKRLGTAHAAGKDGGTSTRRGTR